MRLKKQDDGYWRAVVASLGTPLDNPPAEGEVDLRGAVAPGWSLDEASTVRVDYGMERYYLPEGEGLAIERDMRVRPFGILAVVDKDGTPQIKALMDGGKVLFDNVTVAFPPGRRFALTGPNGAGKSTFMKLLTGELTPQDAMDQCAQQFNAITDELGRDAQIVPDHLHLGIQPVDAELTRVITDATSPAAITTSSIFLRIRPAARG